MAIENSTRWYLRIVLVAFLATVAHGCSFDAPLPDPLGTPDPTSERTPDLTAQLSTTGAPISACTFEVAASVAEESATRSGWVTGGSRKLSPARIAVRGDTTVVSAPRRSRILKLDVHGKVVAQLATAKKPLGLAVDRCGRIYVGSADTGVIEVFDGGGKLLRRIGANDLVMPNSIAVDSRFRVAVADSAVHRVVLFDGTSGQKLLTLGGDRSAVAGSFDFPAAVAFVEREGEKTTLLVADQRNKRVQVFDTEGSLVTVIGPELGGELSRLVGVQDVCAFPNGDVAVLDARQSRIFLFNAVGARIKTLGHHGNAPGEMVQPLGIACDAGRSQIVLADYKLSRITRIGR